MMADFTDLAVRPQEMVVRRRDGTVLARPLLGKTLSNASGLPFLLSIAAICRRCCASAPRKRRASPSAGPAAGGPARDGNKRRRHLRWPLRRAGADISGSSYRADGLWSRVRPLSGLPQPSLPQGKTAWRGLIPREAAPIFAREAKVNLWLGPNAHLVHYPSRAGKR